MNKKTIDCTCSKTDTEEFCPLCCPEEFECLEKPHIKKLMRDEVTFDSRAHQALSRAWWWIILERFNLHDKSLSDEEYKKVEEEFTKTFTIQNLCAHYDAVWNKRGVGGKTLAALRKTAQENNILIVSEYLDRRNSPDSHIIRIK